MINSRSLDELHPHVKKLAKTFIDLCAANHIDILVTSTYRDKESQDALYAEGRTIPGKIRTNARGGQSFHNYRLAFDFVPIVGGKCVWNDAALWDKCGVIGESIGLVWAGRWKTFKEKAHFQWTNGLTLKDLQAGRTP